MRLHDQVAIVTGGGRGIGRAIAKGFAQEGATVVIADIDAEHGNATYQEIVASGGKARFMATQVADQASVAAMAQAVVAEFGRIDILVNNAAILGENGHIFDVTWTFGTRDWREPNRRLSLFANRGQGDGPSASWQHHQHLVGQRHRPQPRCVAYGAAKGRGGVYDDFAGGGLAPYGIRANCIAPGPIQSHMPDDAPPRQTQRVLLGRTGLPSEVAKVAIFLASEESSYVNGQVIAVDGGCWSMVFALSHGMAHGLAASITTRCRQRTSRVTRKQTIDMTKSRACRSLFGS